MSKSHPLSLLACNVYVSAGQKTSHEKVLVHLLREAQSTCLSLSGDIKKSTGNNHGISITTTSRESPAVQFDESLAHDSFLPTLEQQRVLLSSLAKRNVLPPAVMIVHAYADPAYNRSSFHLAGTRADAIATVASTLAISAIQMLRQEENDDETVDWSSIPENAASTNRNHTQHPFVGHVDHVSVMPLISPTGQDVGNHNNNMVDEFTLSPTFASGRAARAIGTALKRSKLMDEVYYYGDARPLATVRRERTRFFRTGGCADHPTNHSTTPQPQLSTVGAPPEFVENYNISPDAKL
jgi:hypothetical protein